MARLRLNLGASAELQFAEVRSLLAATWVAEISDHAAPLFYEVVEEEWAGARSARRSRVCTNEALLNVRRRSPRAKCLHEYWRPYWGLNVLLYIMTQQSAVSRQYFSPL